MAFNKWSQPIYKSFRDNFDIFLSNLAFNVLIIVNLIGIIKGAFDSICKKERKWNQIKKGNGNDNYYFVNLFCSDKKLNHIIYDSLSLLLKKRKRGERERE